MEKRKKIIAKKYAMYSGNTKATEILERKLLRKGYTQEQLEEIKSLAFAQEESAE